VQNNPVFNVDGATLHSLECLVSNKTQSGALCVEMSGCSLSLSGSHIVLILGCSFFGTLTILYIVFSTDCFKRRRERSLALSAERHSKMRNFVVQARRFIMQRDVVRAPPAPHAHTCARIWQPGSRLNGPISPNTRSMLRRHATSPAEFNEFNEPIKTSKPGKPIAQRSRVYASSAPNGLSPQHSPRSPRSPNGILYRYRYKYR